MNGEIIARALKIKKLDEQVNDLITQKLAAIGDGEWEQVATIEKALRDLLAEVSIRAGTLAALILEANRIEEGKTHEHND